MTAQREKWGVSGSVSLGMHFFGALALCLAPVSHPQASVPSDPVSFTIELRAPEPIEAPAPRPIEPWRSSPRHLPLRREPAPAPTPPVPSTPPSRIDQATPIDRPAPDSPPDLEMIHPPIPSLDPARLTSLRVFHGPGPSIPGPPAPLSDDSPDRRPTPIGEALATIQGSLMSDANARPWLSEREYPLVRRPDGAYHYEGVGFEGIVEPDGSIRFSDRPGIAYDAMTGTGTLDLTDLVMGSLGQDPYASERLGFLDAAESLCERLADEARAAAGLRSLRHLAGRVASIWQDETRTAAARRAALFELWDQQADGAEGAPARDVVMAFIREELSLGPEMAFGAGELARLNAMREGVEVFAP